MIRRSARSSRSSRSGSGSPSTGPITTPHYPRTASPLLVDANARTRRAGATKEPGKLSASSAIMKGRSLDLRVDTSSLSCYVSRTQPNNGRIHSRVPSRSSAWVAQQNPTQRRGVLTQLQTSCFYRCAVRGRDNAPSLHRERSKDSGVSGRLSEWLAPSGDQITPLAARRRQLAFKGEHCPSWSVS